ncbi:MAG: Na+/H+ antiporter subunit E [Eubacterium sp.]|nr:Na+/H+ antiporter subunit E [Eubacterium sp.]
MYVLYLLLFIIFNGKLTLEIFVIGAVIAALMLAFSCKFLTHSLKKEAIIYRSIGCFIYYIVVLLIEIIKANGYVIKVILTPHYKIEPAVVSFKTNIKSPQLKTFLANAITLTPGTITAEVNDDTFTVHCLDKSLAEGIEDSVFVRLLKKMEDKYVQ